MNLDFTIDRVDYFKENSYYSEAKSGTIEDRESEVNEDEEQSSFAGSDPNYEIEEDLETPQNLSQ